MAAPFTETIDHAGYFIQMGMASIPIWMESVINRKYPEWRNVKMNLRPGLYSWWGPASFKIGALLMWLAKLRKTNGPHFTWPLLMFSSALPERLMYKMGKLDERTPLRIKTRAELLASIKPNYWKFLREDNGDLPTNGGTRSPAQSPV